MKMTPNPACKDSELKYHEFGSLRVLSISEGSIFPEYLNFVGSLYL